MKLKNLKCPECQTRGEYCTDVNMNTYCLKCGLVVHSVYPYSGGIRHKSLSDFDIEKEEAIQKKILERRLKRYERKKRDFDRKRNNRCE